MYVTNVSGSSRFPKPKPSDGDSWLNYWERETGIFLNEDERYKCPMCGKDFLRKNFDGAHVQKLSFVDKSWYIIPICDSCNHAEGYHNVSVQLVPIPSNR